MTEWKIVLQVVTNDNMQAQEVARCTESQVGRVGKCFVFSVEPGPNQNGDSFYNEQVGRLKTVAHTDKDVPRLDPIPDSVCGTVDKLPRSGSIPILRAQPYGRLREAAVNTAFSAITQKIIEDYGVDPEMENTSLQLCSSSPPDLSLRNKLELELYKAYDAGLVHGIRRENEPDPV